MSEIHNVSILLVDPEREFRQNIKILLKLYNELEIFNLNLVGESDCFERGLNLLDKHKANLILLGLEFDRSRNNYGLDLLKTAKKTSKIIVFSKDRQGENIFEAMKWGADGYVYKNNTAERFYEAITTVLNLGVYFPPDVAVRFFSYFNNLYSRSKDTSNSRFPEANGSLHLTLREKEVLKYLIEGFTNKKIAQQLSITIATVKAHLTSIFHKLGVENRSQAIIAALNSNLSSLLLEGTGNGKQRIG